MRIKILMFSIFTLHAVGLFSQKMSADQYWIPLTDKNYNNYSLDRPNEFLSQKSIDRRDRYNIELKTEDLPVSSYYTDSLSSLGLKITGTSKWFNAVLIETTDTALLDTLDYLEFVRDFSPHIQSFSESISECVKEENINFDEKLEYGESFVQSNLLGGVALHQLGYKGDGLQIAILDAGFYQVDSFQVFQSLWSNNQILGVKDFVNPEGDIFNESSHGMKVLSTMSVSVPGYYIGTAPEASFYLLRSEDAPRENKVEEAYWILAAEYADSLGVDIITTSLGYYSFDSIQMDYTWEDLDGNSALVTRAAEIAFSKGMVVIASAGNERNKTWKKITPPADGQNVLAVGSIDTSLYVSSFSSTGYTEDGRVKPDILAVGSKTQLVNDFGEFGYGNGTSYAAPQIAGLAACLWQAMPQKTNLEIIEAIRHSSHLYSNPDSLHGYGIPNFMVALWYLNNIDNYSLHSDISLFPNPFTSVFYFLPPEDIHTISLYSINGTLLYTKKGKWLKGEIVQIDDSGIDQPGIYFLIIRNDKREIVSKLIRK